MIGQKEWKWRVRLLRDSSKFKSRLLLPFLPSKLIVFDDVVLILIRQKHNTLQLILREIRGKDSLLKNIKQKKNSVNFLGRTFFYRIMKIMLVCFLNHLRILKSLMVISSLSEYFFLWKKGVWLRKWTKGFFIEMNSLEKKKLL